MVYEGKMSRYFRRMEDSRCASAGRRQPQKSRKQSTGSKEGAAVARLPRHDGGTVRGWSYSSNAHWLRENERVILNESGRG